jgi:hypothetical protein
MLPDKDPFDYSWFTYLWIVGLAMWGGVVSFYNKMKDGNVRAINFTELIGELFTSGFVGIMTFYLCEAAHFAPLVTAACVGISGHMGSRGIFMLEKWLTDFLDKRMKP